MFHIWTLSEHYWLIFISRTSVISHNGVQGMRTRSATVLFRNVSLRKKRPKRPNHRSRPADGSISNHIFSGQTICPYDADTCFERNQISRHPESGKLQGNSGIPLSGVFGLKSGKMLLILSGPPLILRSFSGLPAWQWIKLSAKSG